MLCELKAVKLYMFVEVYFVSTTFIEILFLGAGFVSFMFSADKTTESSIILSTYLPFLPLHVARFQIYNCFRTHNVLMDFYIYNDTYLYSIFDFKYIFDYQTYIHTSRIYILLMFLIHLFLQSC